MSLSNRRAKGRPRRLLLALLACAGAACTAEQNEPRGQGAAPAIEQQTRALEGQSRPRTALLGLELWRDGKANLAFAMPKEFEFDPYRATISDANVKVEVFNRDRVLLGTTEAAVTLCSCPATETHYQGDVEVPHETMVLLKVPYVDGDEQVRVTWLEPNGEWREVLSARMPGGVK